MKADAAALRRALAAPAATRLYLFHGPDESGAAAAAARIAAALGEPLERVDLDGATLRREPGRLADEAASLSLFGGRRLIQASRVGEESLEALTLLLASEWVEHPTVALAPAVRSSARIVKLGIASPAALAAAFYEPSAADAERIAATLAREVGLLVEPGVARRIADAAGNDRALMARELDKLALYLDAEPRRPHPLDHAALDAIAAEPAEGGLDEIVAALVGGSPAALGAAFDRVGAAGASPVSWLRAATRRLLTLAAMRSEIDGGDAVAAVMKRHRVFFRDEAATAAALRHWSAPRLAAAIGRLRSAERGAMAGKSAGAVTAEAAALTIARAAAARR